MKFLNSSKKHFLSLIGIVIFVIILFRLDISSIWEYIIQANPYLLFSSLILIFPIVLIRSFRWQILIKKNLQEKSLPLKKYYHLYWIGIFWSSITPGKLGDFIKALYLKKRNFALNFSIFSIIIDRLFDILSLLFLACLGMLLFWDIFQSILFYIIIISGVILIIFFFIWNNKFNFKELLKKLMYFIVPPKYKNQVILNLSDFKNYLLLTFRKNTFLLSVLSLTAWFIYFLQIYLLAIAINIPVSFLFLSICISIFSALSMLPITISGIGTRDLTLIILFSQLGINKESAIALSLMILFLFIINILIGWLYSIIEPIKPKILTTSISNESKPY